MRDYCFFKKAKKIVALEKTDRASASRLIAQGYERQAEEASAENEKDALARFADIRRNNKIDHENFLAGAGTMPFIGVLTAVANFLIRKK